MPAMSTAAPLKARPGASESPAPPDSSPPVGWITAKNHQYLQNASMPNPLCQAQDLPATYPGSYEAVVGLADGRRVEIRPILPSDAPELAEAIRTADPDTLRSRFLGGPPPLTDAVLGGLTRVDYVSRFALVARNRGRGVAVARYAAVTQSGQGSAVAVAEVAVAVAPDWRGVGLATALIKMLARRARECDITEFTALFLAENRPVTDLAHEGHAHVVIAEGVARLDASLTASFLRSPSDVRPEERRR